MRNKISLLLEGYNPVSVRRVFTKRLGRVEGNQLKCIIRVLFKNDTYKSGAVCDDFILVLSDCCMACLRFLDSRLSSRKISG